MLDIEQKDVLKAPIYAPSPLPATWAYVANWLTYPSPCLTTWPTRANRWAQPRL